MAGSEDPLNELVLNIERTRIRIGRSVEANGRGAFATGDIEGNEDVLRSRPVGIAGVKRRKMCLNCGGVGRPSTRCEECGNSFCSKECAEESEEDGRHDGSACKARRVARELSERRLDAEGAALAELAIDVLSREGNGLEGPSARHAMALSEPGAELARAYGQEAKWRRAKEAAEVAHTAMEESPVGRNRRAPKGARNVAALLAKDACNGFAFFDDSDRPVGIGLFPAAALINHSCAPNSSHARFRRRGGGELVVKAAENIGAGEEVTASYIPLLGDDATRAIQLRAWCFDCGCARCTSGEREEAVTARACPGCGSLRFPWDGEMPLASCSCPIPNLIWPSPPLLQGGLNEMDAKGQPTHDE